jgi:hypothetical protein
VVKGRWRQEQVELWARDIMCFREQDVEVLKVWSGDELTSAPVPETLSAAAFDTVIVTRASSNWWRQLREL